MDIGICFGNYFDYENDSVAIQREIDLIEGLSQPWIDKSFPPDPRSVYYDVYNTPKDCLPGDSMIWKRLCLREIIGCSDPQTYYGNSLSSSIEVGALGDRYFIDSLRLLSTTPDLFRKLIVSDQNSRFGIYTFKFFKLGKWRYVHIDDSIPCRESGKVHFCRNKNQNETFAMLFEKAWAKLHGNYEAIIHGGLEQTLVELTEGASVKCFRSEFYNEPQPVCDYLWSLIENGLREECLIGCGRYLSDSYSDNLTDRNGLMPGHIYQVVDIAEVSSDASQDYDQLTLGMVCVRNLLCKGGQFRGRWSFGSELWSQYEQIGMKLLRRTRLLQFQRGLGPDPRSLGEKADSLSREDIVILSRTVADMYPEKGLEHKKFPPQPMAPDLHWISIEDFSEAFTRVYVMTDLSLRDKFCSRRFISSWFPGDFVCGSGGPPLLKQLLPPSSMTANDRDPFLVLPQNRPPPPNYKPSSPTPPHNGRMSFDLTLNPSFTDNPMYPFSVSESTVACFSLYQADRRWNVQRFDVTEPSHSSPETQTQLMDRERRLFFCMDYPIAIGFLVVRLCGRKFRLTDFKLRKVVGGSNKISHSSVVTGSLHLSPGRYALIPFTQSLLSEHSPVDYILHCQCLLGHLDFEVEDVARERLVDDQPSDDEDEDEAGDGDMEGIDVEALRREREAALKLAADSFVLPPSLEVVEGWEYTEPLSGVGVQSMFDEIGQLSNYLSDLKLQASQLQSSFDLLTDFFQNNPDLPTLIDFVSAGEETDRLYQIKRNEEKSSTQKTVTNDSQNKRQHSIRKK